MEPLVVAGLVDSDPLAARELGLSPNAGLVEIPRPDSLLVARSAIN